MRWGHLLLRGAVHLISRLRRQLPLIGEADMLSSEVQHLKKKKDNTHSNGFPYEGKLSPEATDEVGAAA